MKIGIIGHLKYPIARPYAGGLEAFTHTFVQRLVRHGHDVTLFASGDSDPGLPLCPIIDRASIPECKRRFSAADHGWIESVEDEAYQSLMLQLASSDFDVIHNHSINPIPLRFADRLPTRLLTTLHVPVLPRLREEIQRRGSDPCGDFVNISTFNSVAWQSLLPQQSVVYNGVDTEFWKFSGSCKQRRAVWLGRILPDKGTHLAIDAAHRAGLPIDVVGPVTDVDYYDNEVMSRLRSGDAYLGHKTHEELCSIISRSSVAVVTPCWDEPFGLVVTEALACGTPVAAFSRGALPEIIGPSVGRLAIPGDVNDLAIGIRECLQLSGEVCRRYTQEKFSFDRMVTDYERMYASRCERVVEFAA